MAVADNKLSIWLVSWCTTTNLRHTPNHGVVYPIPESLKHLQGLLEGRLRG